MSDVENDKNDARDEAEQFNVWLTNRLRSSLTKSEEAELALRFESNRSALREENRRLRELLTECVEELSVLQDERSIIDDSERYVEIDVIMKSVEKELSRQGDSP